MDAEKIKNLLSPEKLDALFPIARSNDFFDAFYGGSEDSHFDIRLSFDGVKDNCLFFAFTLVQRPGKCLACNMTYGLPQVFARHPILNINGLVADIASLLQINPAALQWKLGSTSPQSSDIHKIPLVISVVQS